ncbi:MAG: twin-arginine translocase TatA/TatE family subunit [Bacteroidales bacterium]|jgi:sec-independent protein translocase protein TatA|nr:twin-arginine translocase TatA/TatE family subunit [Bacteroidales bacterium]
MTHTVLFIGGLRGGEILIIAILVLVLFGGKKIPELMKGIGKGVRSFKEGLNEVEKPLPEDAKTGNNAPQQVVNLR